MTLLTALLLAATALCVFAWVKALRAAKRRQKEKEELVRALEYEKQLRKDFAALDRDACAAVSAERLTEGVCTYLQLWLETQPDLTAAFDSLTEPQKLAYALGYVIQDSRKSLSHFFRANGKPLTPWALRAVEELIGGPYAAIFREAYGAFDEENEEVSLLPANIQAWNASFAALRQEEPEALYAEARAFLLAHLEELARLGGPSPVSGDCGVVS
jgi:hypothetical protein